MNTGKRLHIHIRCAPYGSSRAMSAIDAALAAGAFDQAVQIFLSGDGVLLALAQQQAHCIEQKSADKVLSALPLYDMPPLVVNAGSLQERGLDASALLAHTRCLTPEAFSQALSDADHVLGF